MQNLDGVGRVYYGGFKNRKCITSKGLEARIQLLLNLLMEYTIHHCMYLVCFNFICSLIL